MVEFEGEVVPFDLMPEQAFVVGSIFGWQRRDGDRWVRRFTSAYIEGGKGSGKTPLAAGIGLLMMLADDEMSAEVYAAGSKRDQAMILFSDAVAMAQRSPQISALHLVFSGKNPVWQITDRSTNSKFRPLSSDKKKSGLRVHCGLVDELHEHQDRYTVDMLKDGFKARKQPLLFVITNSGFDRATVCWEWHEHACAVVEGLREDDQLFAYVMALDDADDPLEDESCWPKTNPGLGRTITLQYLRQQVSEANQIPGRENQVRRLNFCQWTDADLGWMTRNSWKSIEEELVEFKKPKLGSLLGGGAAIAPGFLGAMCYLGLDLAYAFDLAALAFLFPEKAKADRLDRVFYSGRDCGRAREKGRRPLCAMDRSGLDSRRSGEGHPQRTHRGADRRGLGSIRYPLRGVRSLPSQRARSGNGRARRRRSMDRASARLPARGTAAVPAISRDRWEGARQSAMDAGLDREARGADHRKDDRNSAVAGNTSASLERRHTSGPEGDGRAHL
jgi:phage terminase large subunit-like protein